MRSERKAHVRFDEGKLAWERGGGMSRDTHRGIEGRGGGGSSDNELGKKKKNQVVPGKGKKHNGQSPRFREKGREESL